MIYSFVPTGTATGPDWEYRIERNGLFTPWVEWSAELIFNMDPDGGDFRTGILYWLYARNALIPDNEPGSLGKVLVAPFEITESNRVVSGSPGGQVDIGTGSLFELIAAATDTEVGLALVTLFTKAMANPAYKKIICDFMATCDTVVTPEPTLVFINPVDYEAIPVVTVDSIDVEILDADWEGTDGDSIDVEILDADWEGEADNPVPTVNHHQADQLITASGDQHYDLNADLFSDPGDSQSLIVRQVVDLATTTVAALPTGVSFGFDAGTGLRRISVASGVSDQVLNIWVSDTDSAFQSIWDIHKLTINRAQARQLADTSWATHSNDFSFNFFTEEGGPSDGYAFIGSAGTWSWSTGQLCQTNTASSADQRMLQFTTGGSQNSLNADQALCLLKPTAFTTDSRLGLGLRYGSAASDGYYFGLKDAVTIQFVHNGVGIGPTASFATSLNTWYYLRLKYEETGSSTAKLSAKIWNALQAEPDAWTMVWEDQPRKAGYPVLSGGFNGSKGCFGPWYDAITLAP
ncbi:hypothetical protein EXU85_20225 [Spirosoma sp. KCTC 42546]|uniref:hypothetical protein n=1 Tax=Spirosoma sp. KCTC 42546 TaxID=2520506 RepID=UPI00115A6318|nr:hypothetical protein [Spirosoma sp. KCTC 42546]QDK80806.1 hypothetical protein EXU85_20225 [Spirosoma sp. KCTC 42546]